MDSFGLIHLEETLGVTVPWRIRSVDVDAAAHHLHIHIDVSDKKKLFGLIEQASKEGSDQKRVATKWRYMPVGTFQTTIHAEVPSEAENVLNLDMFSRPAFVGHTNRNYSNYLRQQVALAQLQGFSAEQIRYIFVLELQEVEQILQDIRMAEPQVRALAHLPTEVDSIWRRIIADKMHVRTNVLPLKLLLSKFKLAALKTSSSDDISVLCRQLRQFFVSNAYRVDSEIDQICGLSGEHQRRNVSAIKQRQKLVLPSIKNSVWIDLFSGKLNLNSTSVPLKFLLSRQRVTFLQAKTVDARVGAIEAIRDYFKKNHRFLRAELVLINRAMAINEKTRVRLPDPAHDVWQKILSDDRLIASENVAYRLFLSKLRAKVQSTRDPVVKLEAARSIRNFVRQNHRALKRELNLIVKQSEAV